MSGTSTPTVFDGTSASVSRGTRIAIAVARWNESITRRLLAGALHRFGVAGVAADAVDVAWVPGSFELPLAADALAATDRYAAVLCLGAIIKGDTSHDHHIATAAAAGIEAAGRDHGLPVIFGVLTCDTLAQAMVRAGGDEADGFAGNKGAECAAAAIEMAGLLEAIRRGGAA
ncbi:MAG: 6,7-dimethyl-8-ribityllumazine synthase [Planctomycetes bacterium]|nr:6,7-dimethyl-8-ribityllumazine synthase [Planctomycetota bacterium]